MSEIRLKPDEAVRRSTRFPIQDKEPIAFLRRKYAACLLAELIYISIQQRKSSHETVIRRLIRNRVDLFLAVEVHQLRLSRFLDGASIQYNVHGTVGDELQSFRT